MILGKEKAANEICQRYADNKLPSSLGKGLGGEIKELEEHLIRGRNGEKYGEPVVVGYI